MKINIFKYSLLFLVLFLSSQSFGQTVAKFGYLNSQSLLSDIPEVKQANSNLEALQAQLEKKGQQMVADLENKYKELQRKEQSGEISPKALEDDAKKLKEQEAEIGKFEQDVQKQLMAKRQEMLQPIIDKVNKIIKEVAAENQFTYIFDSSSGILLFAQESLDIMPLVKAKLGI
ncbi:MAG: OmpH family outer membrane protein [Saprospiraceae bacterium]|nr:OmpH family outer membrane protein [Saprospiraceae bacterium]